MNHRLRTKWGALALLAGLAGCAADDPVAPAEGGPEGGTALAALAPADVQKGTYVFTFDQVHYWGCVGEMIHNVFEVTVRYTQILLPNGEYVYRELWPAGITGTITGLTSGTVWQRRQVSPYVKRSTGGGMEMWTDHVTFFSETGPTVEVHEMFHLSANANGEVTVDQYVSDCKLHYVPTPIRGVDQESR